MTTRASIDQIRQREGDKRRLIRKLMKDATTAHATGLSDEAKAQRYDAIMARLNEIEEGEG
ncbi:hypothetical protein KUV62_15810 [Salipiger bermudensis]|uniref:hypothetical protein n=1 Tax=Salipiger bermudensis TaxID=344736 RepID=UPI001C99B610|nr:hypothetical protein [Salipiger bermudensis]MBY6005391.1 hypothetical protein [Salipiger bermudensis]